MKKGREKEGKGESKSKSGKIQGMWVKMGKKMLRRIPVMRELLQ
jgi:hypothetical protein